MKTKLPANTDEYIASFPVEVQTRLQQIRAVIKKAAPAATEVISYGMPAFKLKSVLVYFAAYKSHIGFYPTSSPIRAFADELGKYKWSKGAVQFPLDKPIPAALVSKMVKYRVKEVAEKENLKIKPAESPFAFLAAPAQRALKNNNIKTLKQLSAHSEKEIAALHGIGGNALTALKKALKQQELSLK